MISSSERANAARRQTSMSTTTRSKHRPGITLIEMMIAIALTLIMMFGIARAFELLGNSVDTGRATIEMAGQLRSVLHQLQQDLDGLTVRTLPWNRPDSGEGYFEYVEGPGRDIDSDGNGTPNLGTDTMFGDFDDVLMFTARSHGQPFVGHAESIGAIESNVAEIVWWAHQDDTNGSGSPDSGDVIKLHRRVLLVRPDLNNPVTGLISGEALDDFLNHNDISVRPHPSGGVIANSLADLTKRENRFDHLATFPHALDLPIEDLSGEHLGEDVVLTRVLAFDVKAYDPLAPIHSDNTVALNPSDPAYESAGITIGRGAYVDLFYTRNTGLPQNRSQFSGSPDTKSKLWEATGLPVGTATYDTWPFHYEHDGVNQDDWVTVGSDIDEGTNGLDDDGQNGVDDVGERETSPPYPFPLRGLKVTIRMIESDTRQVRQVSVVADFVPE